MTDNAREIDKISITFYSNGVVQDDVPFYPEHIIQSQSARIAELEAHIKLLEFYTCHAPRCSATKAAKKHELAACTCGLDELINHQENTK